MNIKYNLELRVKRYVDKFNSILKNDIRTEFFSVDDVVSFIENNKVDLDTETFYYGDYILEIDKYFINNLDECKLYIEDYIKDVEDFENKKYKLKERY